MTSPISSAIHRAFVTRTKILIMIKVENCLCASAFSHWFSQLKYRKPIDIGRRFCPCQHLTFGCRALFGENVCNKSSMSKLHAGSHRNVPRQSMLDAPVRVTHRRRFPTSQRGIPWATDPDESMHHSRRPLSVDVSVQAVNPSQMYDHETAYASTIHPVTSGYFSQENDRASSFNSVETQTELHRTILPDTRIRGHMRPGHTQLLRTHVNPSRVCSIKDRPPFYPPGPNLSVTHLCHRDVERIKQARMTYGRVSYARMGRLRGHLSTSTPDFSSCYDKIQSCVEGPLEISIPPYTKLNASRMLTNRKAMKLSKSLGNMTCTHDQRLSRRLAQTDYRSCSTDRACPHSSSDRLVPHNDGGNQLARSKSSGHLNKPKTDKTKVQELIDLFDELATPDGKTEALEWRQATARKNAHKSRSLTGRFSAVLSFQLASNSSNRYVAVCDFENNMVLELSTNPMGNVARLQATGLRQTLTLLRAKTVYDLTFRPDNSPPWWWETDGEDEVRLWE